MRLVTALAALTLTVAIAGNAQNAIFEEKFNGPLRSIWKPLKFEGLTSYKIVADGDNSVIQATADSAASGLVAEVNAASREGLILGWRWKIDSVPPGATETEKKSFDHTARVFIAHKPRIGLPTTLNYVWAATGKAEEIYEHPSSGRSKFIILQSGNGQANKWMIEMRDVVADWKKAFGEAPPKTLTALGFMTDSDGTSSSVVGHYDDFVLSKGSLPGSPTKP